ncbi:lipid-A-disaccharide synthase [Mangrovicella endophytica]|uniref:lipid-A-disaccharide synthase n=1 Tax=Mangrovicella endophytica TaxID=2066697 RepID=UPI000C9EC2F9|nr:lipid-A-disaccharide synthase [Mangrovicella endophytica]
MKVAFIVGEESGDRIGADLIRGLRRLDPDLEVTGLGGPAMQDEGLTSLFDIGELSIIGVGAIIARLPQLLRRLAQATRHVIAERPDALVIIDSPTFSHRVAKRVRQAAPEIAIVNYVPPTVWAWRPERAAAMRPYVDHAVCVFPFEPALMAKLGGPPSTYVGHPLMSEPHLADLMARAGRDVPPRHPATPPTLLILPGSRRGEIARLLADFGATLALVKQRVPDVEAVLPAVERLRPAIEAEVANWPVKPRLVSGAEAKWQAFGEADAALAASGTVSLELALAGVPMALAYKLDPIGYRLRHLISGWTAALPNYIAGHPLVPEHFHEFVRPEHLARRLERLLADTPERRAQIEGFAGIRRAMAVEHRPGDLAAAVVLKTVKDRRAGRSRI